MTKKYSRKKQQVNRKKSTENQSRWNTYLGTATSNNGGPVVYTVGQTYTTPAVVATNAPAGATASPDYGSINENDLWKAMTIISDGDGTI